jgi:hypothetical protein
MQQQQGVTPYMGSPSHPSHVSESRQVANLVSESAIGSLPLATLLRKGLRKRMGWGGVGGGGAQAEGEWEGRNGRREGEGRAREGMRGGEGGRGGASERARDDGREEAWLFLSTSIQAHMVVLGRILQWMGGGLR